MLNTCFSSGDDQEATSDAQPNEDEEGESEIISTLHRRPKMIRYREKREGRM